MRDKTKTILIIGPSLAVLASTVLVILWRVFWGGNSVLTLYAMGYSLSDIIRNHLLYYLFATASGIGLALIVFRHAWGRWLALILFAIEALSWLYFTLNLLFSEGRFWYLEAGAPVSDIVEAVFYQLHSLIGLLLIFPLLTSAAVRGYFRKAALETVPGRA